MSVAGRDRRASGELSALVMDVLRQANSALTAREVRGQFAAMGVGPLAYTTVVTTLSRLHMQGLADRFRRGRAYAYQAVSGHQLTARRMRRLLDAADDRTEVLAQFVGALDAGDERVMCDLLRQRAAASGVQAASGAQAPNAGQAPAR
jgi:predicted transcriptional regulator